MLDANTPAFRQQYPNGAIVYDRTGRRISGVVACDLETGEVITHAVGWIAKAWFNALWVQDPFSHTYLRRFDWLSIGPRLLRETVVGGELFRRHGFWPAPLTIRPNMPPPPKHPMCPCISIPLKPATEADLSFVINEPLPEVAWRSLLTGETVTI